VRRFCEGLGRSARVLWGACDPLFTPSPLGPLLAVAEGTGGGLAAAVERGAMPYEVVTAPGARRLRERGARRLPRGPRPATRRNPAGLTPREVEVLALVADGLRYTDIAARLVLSERTVDHHVGAILRKLGVRTRAQASAEAVRLGLTRQDA
jgi:DNA-binding NarL/FixJ family response regulator